MGCELVLSSYEFSPYLSTGQLSEGIFWERMIDRVDSTARESFFLWPSITKELHHFGKR